MRPGRAGACAGAQRTGPRAPPWPWGVPIRPAPVREWKNPSSSHQANAAAQDVTASPEGVGVSPGGSATSSMLGHGWRHANSNSGSSADGSSNGVSLNSQGLNESSHSGPSTSQQHHHTQHEKQQQQQQQQQQRWRQQQQQQQRRPRRTAHASLEWPPARNDPAYRQQQSDLAAAMRAAQTVPQLARLVLPAATAGAAGLDPISASCAFCCFARLVAGDQEQQEDLQAVWRRRSSSSDGDTGAGSSEVTTSSSGDSTTRSEQLARLHALLLRLVMERVPYFQGRQLANCLHALGRLHCRNSTAAAALLSASAPLLHQHGPQELANSVWALGALRLSPPSAWLDGWFDASREVIHRSGGGFDNSSISNSSSRSDKREEASTGPSPRHQQEQREGRQQRWQQHGGSSSSRQPGFTPQELANAAWGLGRLRASPPSDWLTVFYASSASDWADYTPQQLSNLLLGVSRLTDSSCGIGAAAAVPAWWLTAAVEAVEARLGGFTASELSTAMWALACIWHQQRQPRRATGSSSSSSNGSRSGGVVEEADEWAAARDALAQFVLHGCSALVRGSSRRVEAGHVAHSQQQQDEVEDDQQQQQQQQQPQRVGLLRPRPQRRLQLRRPTSSSSGATSAGTFDGTFGGPPHLDLKPRDVVRALTLCAAISGAGCWGDDTHRPRSPCLSEDGVVLPALADVEVPPTGKVAASGQQQQQQQSAASMRLPPALLSRMAAALLRASARHGYQRRPGSSWDLCAGLRLLQLLGFTPGLRGGFLPAALEDVHEHLPCLRLGDSAAIASALLAWGTAPPAAWAADFARMVTQRLAAAAPGGHGGTTGASSSSSGGGASMWSAAVESGRAARAMPARVSALLRFVSAAEKAQGGCSGGNGGGLWRSPEERGAWCMAALRAAITAASASSSSSSSSSSPRSLRDAAGVVALALVHLVPLAQRQQQDAASGDSGAAAAAWAIALQPFERRLWRRMLQQWSELRLHAVSAPQLHAAADAAAASLQDALKAHGPLKVKPSNAHNASSIMAGNGHPMGDQLHLLLPAAGGAALVNGHAVLVNSAQSACNVLAPHGAHQQSGLQSEARPQAVVRRTPAVVIPATAAVAPPPP